MVKNLPAIQETWVLSLGQEDPLEEGMATHSSIFAWRISWTEEPGRLQFMGSERVGHDWSMNTSLQVDEKLHSDLIYFGYNAMYIGFLCVNLLLSLQIWYKLLWIVDWCEPQNRVSTYTHPRAKENLCENHIRNNPGIHDYPLSSNILASRDWESPSNLLLVIAVNYL